MPKSKGARRFVQGRVLVRFRKEVSAYRAYQAIAESNAWSSAELSGVHAHVVEVPGVGREEEYLKQFLSMPEVVSAELDQILEPAQVTPNDPFYTSSEWHLPKIDAPGAWATTTGNGGVVVAVLDTGVDASHPDLASKMVAGWDVYNNGADTSDVTGHGTQVAGVLAAASNNSQGVASVAWNCSVMPVRITNLAGSTTYSAIASGLTWAADHGARVANVSFEATNSSTVQSAAQYFQSKGGVVAMAAGNNGQTDTTVDNPYVLTVSATDQNDVIYPFSNRGSNIDVAAPGTVYTTARGGGYGSAQGTSFATPIVAGVAALVMSVNPQLAGAQVQEVVKKSADDRGSAGWDGLYGWGRVNASRAVSNAAAVAVSGGDVTSPSVSITSPRAGASVPSGVVSVTFAASDNVGVKKVELYLDGKLEASSISAPFTMSWNTRKVKGGSHTLQAKAYDAAGNAGTSAAISVLR
ncbi:MAG TPA: S8 family serine peptidase [Pyrinomonadaceae bacterium]|nr:S8 family serine peptidase [Pyrinomonadaceae bacterium]